MRCRYLYTAVVALLVLTVGACSDDATGPGGGGGTSPSCLDLNEYLHVAAIVPNSGRAQGVALGGDRLFVADGPSGLCVVDLADPSGPLLRGCVALSGGGAIDVALAGGDVVVAWGGAGVAVVDVGNPDLPVVVGRVSTPGNAVDVAVVGTTAYVADDVIGLVVIDLRDRSNPVVTGVENTPGEALGVAVSGQVVYVADAQLGLRVINAADPARPWLIRSLSLPGASGVDVAGGYGYVAAGGNGLHVVRLATVGGEALVTTVPTSGVAADVAVANGVAWVAVEREGVEVFDLSRPASPRLRYWVRTGDVTGDVFVSGDSVVTAEADAGARVILAPRVEQPPVAAGAMGASGDFAGIAVDSARIVAADAAAGLSVLARSGDDLVVSGSVALQSPAGVLLVGDSAYVASTTAAVSIVDVSNPAMPAAAGIVPQSTSVSGMAAADGTLYMARGVAGVLRYDLGGVAPIEQLSLGVAFATDVASTNAHVYATAAGATLYVIRINGFVLSNSVMLRGSATAVTLETRDDIIPSIDVNVAWVALSRGTVGNGPGVQAFDLFNPLLPSEIVFIETAAGAVDVAVSGQTLAVAEGNGGVELFDISDLNRPQPLGYYPAGDAVGAIAATPDLLYVAAGSDGVFAVHLLNCAARGE